jgi:hypothetical protein
MCACPKERKRLSRGIQSYRWRSGTRSTVNMLSRELSSPHLNANGHTWTNLCYTQGSSIVCPVFVRGNARHDSCVNVAHFYQVHQATLAVPSLRVVLLQVPRPRLSSFGWPSTTDPIQRVVKTFAIPGHVVTQCGLDVCDKIS